MLEMTKIMWKTVGYQTDLKCEKSNGLMIFFKPHWCFRTSELRFTMMLLFKITGKWEFTRVKTQRTHSVWKLQLNLPAIALRPQRQQETINQSWAFMAIHQMKPQGYLHRKSTWGSIRVFPSTSQTAVTVLGLQARVRMRALTEHERTRPDQTSVNKIVFQRTYFCNFFFIYHNFTF